MLGNGGAKPKAAGHTFRGHTFAGNRTQTFGHRRHGALSRGAGIAEMGIQGMDQSAVQNTGVVISGIFADRACC